MADHLQFLETRERFLPIKLASLRRRMLCDPRLSADERQQLGKLFEMIAVRFHFEFHEKLERLKAVYEPFDSDNDTLPLDDLAADRTAQREELARQFRQLLVDANYVEMPREQVVACAEYQPQTNLIVRANLTDYAQLQVFFRGVRHEPQTVRLWAFPWRRTIKISHVFSRVALLVRLAKTPDGPVYLKLFKDVVAENLEMLLPFVRIRMKLFDHLKIGSSVAGGVATAAWKMFTAAILSPWLLLLALSGFAGAAIRGIFSFLSSKTKYMQTLSSRLYFQNLANNASALAYLIDAAEAEECKELLLAYYVLYVERNRDFTQEELDRRVEQWLKTEYALDVDFEVPDAVRKLVDKGLLVRRPPSRSTSTGDVLKVYDLPSALRRLDAVWDDYFSFNGALAPDGDRVADADWPPYPSPATKDAGGEAIPQRIDAGRPIAQHPKRLPQPIPGGDRPSHRTSPEPAFLDPGGPSK